MALGSFCPRNDAGQVDAETGKSNKVVALIADFAMTLEPSFFGEQSCITETTQRMSIILIYLAIDFIEIKLFEEVFHEEDKRFGAITTVFS